MLFLTINGIIYCSIVTYLTDVIFNNIDLMYVLITILYWGVYMIIFER